VTGPAPGDKGAPTADTTRSEVQRALRASRSHQDVVQRATRRMRARRVARLVVLGALAVGALATSFLFLRPQALGGRTAYVTVHGISMTPTLDNGNFVVAEREAGYTTGEIIVFHVPIGEPGAGTTVIDRIVGGNGVTGFVTKGDHDTQVDPWHPTTAAVVGRVWFHAPAPVGWVIAALVVLGLLFVVIVALGSVMNAALRRNPDPRVGPSGRASVAATAPPWTADPVSRDVEPVFGAVEPVSWAMATPDASAVATPDASAMATREPGTPAGREAEPSAVNLDVVTPAASAWVAEPTDSYWDPKRAAPTTGTERDPKRKKRRRRPPAPER